MHEEPNTAIQHWRQVLRATPTCWQAALELRRALSAAGHYAESDSLFRGASAHLPDAQWLEYFDSIYALHHDHLDAQQQRAQAMVRRFPDDSRAHRLLGEIAWQHRDLASAEAGFEGCAALRPDDAAILAKLQLVRLYRRLTQRLHAAAPSGDRYAIHLINLDRNPERLAEIERQFRDCPVPLRRIPGIDGSALPQSSIRELVREIDDALRGTLGCFLSHAAAWQAVLDGGLPHGLVIEDDVMPMLDLPARLGPLGLPDGYDLCFVNDRLQPRFAPAAIAQAQDVRVITLADAMLAFPPDENAPGADAYLVSAAGARKLLAWVAEDKHDGDVDWRLLAYGMTPGQIAALPRHSHAWSMLDTLRHGVPRPDRLHANVLCPALIRTVPFSSDREDGNRSGAGREEETNT